MAGNDSDFMIELVDWPGRGPVPNKIPIEGTELATCLALKLPNCGSLLLKKNREEKVTDHKFMPTVYNRKKTVVDGEDYRLDYEELSHEKKFARYEIQKNGKVGKNHHTAIALVFIPVGVKVDGPTVVQAFEQSMSSKPAKSSIIKPKK